jgi:hypothetical protein
MPWEKRRMKSSEISACVSSLEYCRWIGIPAAGDLLTSLPIAGHPRQWLDLAFVPITAAGQRGILTPLPQIHRDWIGFPILFAFEAKSLSKSHSEAVP